MVVPNTEYRIEPMKQNIIRIMDKVDDLERRIDKLNTKIDDDYKLVNDRVDEAFDIIKILERRE